MCQECGFYECPANCPNAPEPKVYGECENCGKEIVEGDECCEIGEHLFCLDCVDEGIHTVETE